MEEKSPAVYEAILAADRESQRFSGHGSAVAQAYNHMILPATRQTNTPDSLGHSRF
jgi:hypothetical protein